MFKKNILNLNQTIMFTLENQGKIKNKIIYKLYQHVSLRL